MLCLGPLKSPDIEDPEEVIADTRTAPSNSSLRLRSSAMQSRVLLVEPDYYTRYPPLGLLKISTMHKSIGDRVKLVRGCKRISFKPDIVYVTSLFTYSWKAVYEAVGFYKRRFPSSKLIL